jgi:hypothetical protein
LRPIKRGRAPAPKLRRVSATRRRWIAACAAVLLLFAQLAGTAHACVRAVTVAPHAHCHDSLPAGGADTALLCKAHCEPGSPNSASAPAADAPAAPPLLAVLDWSTPALQLADPPRRDAVALSGAPPPGAAPLYLALLVLRN